MTGKFPAVLNLNRLFLKLNRFICNYLPVLPDPRLTVCEWPKQGVQEPIRSLVVYMFSSYTILQ